MSKILIFVALLNKITSLVAILSKIQSFVELLNKIPGFVAILSKIQSFHLAFGYIMHTLVSRSSKERIVLTCVEKQFEL